MNNQDCFSDLRHEESDDVNQAPPQKKLQGQPHYVRDHSTHFDIENGSGSEMMKEDEKDVELHQRRVYGQNDHSTKPNALERDRQNIVSDTAEHSKPSSTVSQGSLREVNGLKQAQKLYQTPKVDKRYEAKLSTFENSELFSGARENQYASNYSTIDKKAQGNHSDENSQKSNDIYYNQPIQDQNYEAYQQNLDLSAQSCNQGDFHEDSNQKAGSFSMIRERERRSCRDKTSKYSLTHKGMQSNIQAHEEQALNQNANQIRGLGPQGSDLNMNLGGPETIQESGLIKDGRPDGKAHKKSAPRSTDQCLSTIANMFAFDWSLKDIGNLRHSPQQELTSSIYWFYVNTQYFPFKALDLSQKPLDDLIAPILQNLKPNNNYINKNIEELKQQEHNLIINDQQLQQEILNSNNQQNQDQNIFNARDFSQHDLNQQLTVNNDTSPQNLNLNGDQKPFQQYTPDYIMTLFREKRFRKFKKQFKELMQRLESEKKLDLVENLHTEIHDTLDINIEILPLGEKLQDSSDQQMVEEVIPKSEEQKLIEEKLIERQKQDQTIQEANRNYDSMIDILQREISNIEQSNRDQLKDQAQKLQKSYQIALDADPLTSKDNFVYRQDEMLSYDQEFVSKIDPMLIQDFMINKEWYLENFNEILLNVGHSSKLEKDFLKHIEYVQQKKSDLKYKRILKHIEQGKKGDQITMADLEQYQTLNSAKRNLVAQEDAQCAICNNGDYEEEDMIVFCGNCNVPVHQSCYGIEQLPEGDWVCYNCDIFGMKRGLMLNCLLCPKKGGCMKPTNIFSTVENYKMFNSGGNSSHAKKSSTKGKQTHHHYGQSVSEKICLVDNLTPDKRINIGENEDKNLSLTVILNREFNFQSDLRQRYVLMESPLETLDLIFDANEKITQTPEDYSFFLHKNESRLESHPKTESLYQWVHLSCASWIPGPLVTPKTPVRLNKFDEKRFQLQCIICLKRDGACMQCQASRCTIAFHVECARRNNYCMEIERKDREKTYRMFCEKHRPLKIVKEMEEKDKQTIEEIQKFSKIIDKCMDIDFKHQLKPSKQHEKEKELQKQQKYEREYQEHHQTSMKSYKLPKPEKVRKEKILKEKKIKEVVKKWREKDKKMLFERIKEKYLMFRKMRINIVRVDPMKKFKKSGKSQPARKRSKKRVNKKQTAQSHIGGSRPGLRSKLPGNIEEDKQQDLLQLQQEIMMNDFEEEQKDQNYDNIEQTQLDPTNEQNIDQTDNIEEDQEIYYKLSIPTYPTDIDWTITLSRNDFPWPEIKFNNFTAKDCYEKYVSIVKDAHAFLKKVLGLKEKYKKMMQNQLALAQQIQMQQPVGQQNLAQGVVLTNAQESALYCKCKGAVISDLYVKCDGDDECVNGGWVHPQCTEELKNKSKEELDAIEEWYCEECQARIKKEDAEEDEEQKEEEDQEEEEEEDDQDDDEEQNINQSQQDNQMFIDNTGDNQEIPREDYASHNQIISYQDNKNIQQENDEDHMMIDAEQIDEQELQEAYLRENNNYSIRINASTQSAHLQQQQSKQLYKQLNEDEMDEDEENEGANVRVVAENNNDDSNSRKDSSDSSHSQSSSSSSDHIF